MDYRGHPQPGHSHRSKEREASYRKQDRRDYNQPPPPEPREQDRHWGHPDARHRVHSRPEQHHYSHQQQYLYGYGRPEYQRPPSRQDYGHHSHWDYRDNYGYYDYSRGRQDPNQWAPQDSWWADQYQERAHKQEHPGSNYTEEYRYDKRKDNSQQYLSDYEVNPSRDTEEDSSCHLGTLESSRTSGLSSSSYELSQYMNGAEHIEPQPVEHVQLASAPLKFSVPHPIISFGPAGQLVRVNPGLSAQDKLSQLEIHSLEVILSETQEQQDMRKFPGPLTREDLHKVDAMEFAQQRAAECMRDEKLPDRSSAALLWNLLILLCRQNGQMVGSDIAELLMHGSHSDGAWESDAPTLINFDEEATTEAPPKQGDDLLTGNWSTFTSENSEKALQSYTQLLLAGRKKEALEEAMTCGLWGHALFLASKMDNRSYTTVLNRFTGQLTASDPLQTLFQLLSGRIPAVSACCGNEKWGDWRPHLAVMLSNETGEHGVQRKAVLTMGDTLASRGLIHAAHVCYLTASAPFRAFTQKTERLVLLGSSHRQPFEHFSTNSAIQCTELYEYCQTLLDKSFSIASFQVFKFLYACRLLDCGLSSQAFHYCEVVGQTLLRLTEPLSVLTGELIKLSDRLRFSEGQFSEAGLSGTEQEPDWLKHLRARHHRFQIGSFDSTESFLPALDSRASTHEDKYSVSDVDDLSRDIQSPDLELLYHRGNEEPEILTRQSHGASEGLMPCVFPGSQNWPPASSLPVSSFPPPPPPSAASQHLSYHSTDSGEVGSSAPHCPSTSSPSSAAAGVQSSSGPFGRPVLEVDMGGNSQIQQVLPQGFHSSQQSNKPPKQTTKTGWFSGWFQSKPKDVPQKGSEQKGPAQTELSPSTGLHSSSPPPPPPPAVSPPNMFPSQPPSTSINPFSRKAGQQLG